ncbi:MULTISPECIES: aspartate/glutamate racemase family protein [Croceitalea]|uniref:Amino acid racemase n=1 Tax=Croceitalea vernalis TaxID=3075599 RepID=A0ABU3BCR4_9FLAO|nr:MULTISPECIES: amino acid racemase [unclassified Croceitalea]MDT0538476.1 amino acid racemase [Croceitalea sp. P059]MDT0620254.1 amino acid racemase [Croceitalea sp. P007]
MKIIGLIGGMSWESSKVYYEYLNKLVQQKLGGSHSAKIIMSSVDFSEIKKYSFEDNWDAIGELMAIHAAKLEKAGADMIVLCTNTIHLVSNAIKDAITVPFLHIADATGRAIEEQGLQKIALLGTQFTMEKDFYTRILEDQYGLEVIIPELEDRVFLQDIIYNELVKGKFTTDAKEKCLNIISKLQNQGVEGVILGCTELPILIPDKEVALPTFNTTLVHSQMAIDFALN